MSSDSSDQTRAVPSELPVAMWREVGEKSSEFTRPPWPLQVRTWRNERASHRQTLEMVSAAAKNRPSADHATAFTPLSGAAWITASTVLMSARALHPPASLRAFCGPAGEAAPVDATTLRSKIRAITSGLLRVTD